MAAKFHTEGRRWAFEVLFTLQQSVPNFFYVGLSKDADIPENASLSDIDELANNTANDLGYVRFPLEAGDTDWVSAATGANDRKVTTATVTFTAQSNWDLAKTWFIATSLDDSGKLVCSGEVNSGSGYALSNGESYSFNVEIVWPET